MELVFLSKNKKKGLISLNKLTKTLSALESKYYLIERLQPIFVSVKGIISRKEKCLTSIIDLTEDMETEFQSISEDLKAIALDSAVKNNSYYVFFILKIIRKNVQNHHQRPE